MEELTKPDPEPNPRIGLTFNLKKENHSETRDEEAEYDSAETVFAIKNAIEKLGCTVELLDADDNLAARLSDVKTDIIFNIAEGRGGRAREAQVPTLLDMYGKRYAGSDATTLCVSLDKALTKRLLSTYRIRTPKYRVFSDENKITGLNKLKYPVIVKPNAEGSSKGISDVCIAEDSAVLKRMLKDNLLRYRQPMLVEEYIGGREFTVGVMGNGKTKTVFRPMEIVFIDSDKKYCIYSFDVKQNFKKHIRYDCPAKLEPLLEKEMTETAGKIFDVLECRDFARIDFRLSEDGKIYFIEINPLPGLAPGYSDFPMLAAFNGIDYDTLVQSILKSAIMRYMPQQAEGDEHIERA